MKHTPHPLRTALVSLISFIATVSAPPSLAQSADCRTLARPLPRVTAAMCEAAALKPSGTKSVNGFPIYQRDVVAPAGDAADADAKPRPKVLVLGGIHGDELSSSSLAFHWIALASSTPGGMDWRFVPALNPDGLMQKQPTRVNARGVDLNRNFPTPRWAQEAPQYWVKQTERDPRRFPGKAALSEPETRFVQQTMEKWKPDLIVSVHAPYGVLDYDGPRVPPQRLGRLFLDRVGVFPGSLGYYGGVQKGVPVVTIELASSTSAPNEAETRQMWLDLLRWASERMVAPGR